jgi:WhiB family transcriptional regulator, redox-sensing transcriptional regulator
MAPNGRGRRSQEGCPEGIWFCHGRAVTVPGRLPPPVLKVWGWQFAGACRDADAALFFSSDSERGARRAVREAAAKAICRRCPVRPECSAHALAVGEAHGVWGGMSEADRAKPRG